MKYFGFEFDKVIVIESLPEHEKQIRDGQLLSSGEYYTKIFFPYCNKLRDEPFSFELAHVNSKHELLHKLDLICEKIKLDDEYPLIYFEIHGTENKDGLTICNGDFVDWRTLLDKLTNINILTANNLFVIFATCSGAFNLQYIMPRETVFPYYAALAPDNPEYPVFLEQRYSLFYLDLMIGGDVENAIRQTITENGYARIILSTCEFYLYQAFQQEIAKVKDDNRVEGLIQILNRKPGNCLSNEVLRKLVKDKLFDPMMGERILLKMKEKLLMANDPKNLGRFQFSAMDLMDLYAKQTF